MAHLSDADAREIAELERVPDWHRDRDLGLLFEPFLGTSPEATVQGRRTDRDRLALERAQVLLGRDGVDAARRRAQAAINARSPSWPRMRWHRPLHAAAGAGILIAGAAVVLSRASLLPPPVDLAVTILGCAIAGGTLLWSYLLPPSARDLRVVIERAAVAHAAGERLEGEHFDQLTDGLYAVLEGRWQRGARPYRMWTGLLLGIVVVVLLGAIVTVASPG